MMGFIKGKTGFVRPTFDEYPNRYTEIETVNYLVESEDFSYSASDLIEYFDKTTISNLVLVNPDNPSGNYIPKNDMLRMISWARDKGIKIIIDESFVDFSTEGKLNSLLSNDILEKNGHLIIIKSISKSYGVPGLRLGVLASSDEELIAEMKKDVAIWNINSFAEFYLQIYEKYAKDYAKAIEKFKQTRAAYIKDLQALSGLRVLPTQANYVLCEVTSGVTSRKLAEDLLEENILIKDLSTKKGFDGKNYIRLAVRDEKDNAILVEALKRYL